MKIQTSTHNYLKLVGRVTGVSETGTGKPATVTLSVHNEPGEPDTEVRIVMPEYSDSVRAGVSVRFLGHITSGEYDPGSDTVPGQEITADYIEILDGSTANNNNFNFKKSEVIN